MTTMITEPTVTQRSWIYVYSRPRRMGWPLLERAGWPGAGYHTENITPHKITIAVRQHTDGTVAAESVSVAGKWTATGRSVVRMKVHIDAPREQVLIIHAPDWVLELAADAVRRSEED